MKYFFVCGALLFAGCAQHYDWYIDNYMAANVSNYSSREVKVAFCSQELGLASKVETVFLNSRIILSKTFIKTRVDKTVDRRQNYPVQEYSYSSYAALSFDDRNFTQLCVNEDAFLDRANKNAKTYLVIENSAACPASFKAFDQRENPCQVQF